MVRAHLKPTPEEKKETKKAKTPKPPKEPKPPKSKEPKAPKDSGEGSAGAWPCKIDGCNKQFAREADLKRHQRTTKGHSTPGFACPQCDAAFTRTDALRRHQKSRHNGLVLEAAAPAQSSNGGPSAPIEEDGVAPPGDGPMAGPSSGGPGSHHGTPGPGGPPPGGPNQGGPNSYYRPHVIQAGMHAQGYPAVGLPTSDTRGAWPPAPAPGEQAFQGVPGGPVDYPYYRGQEGQTNEEQAPSGPVIDPALEGSSGAPDNHHGMNNMEITQAAVQAVLQAAGMMPPMHPPPAAESNDDIQTDGEDMLNPSELLTEESLVDS